MRVPAFGAPPGLDGCTALLHYASARRLVTSLKNGGRRDLVAWLADEMASVIAPTSGATVTWAPTGSGRAHARGFDQAELLARAIARRWDLPCHALLRRVPGPAQAGRSRAQRHGGPEFRPRRVCTAEVLVVDDVVTTGATLTAAARALRDGGATRVVAVVAARSSGEPRS